MELKYSEVRLLFYVLLNIIFYFFFLFYSQVII